MTYYEIFTDDKIMRSCAENENIIRGERGDSELSYEKIENILKMPDSYKQHVETSIDTLLFNNPSFKKYAQYSYYTEGTVDFNLQPRKIDNSKEIKINYKEDLDNKIKLSAYKNIQIREIDQDCNII
jgi:hypothetical protein